MHTLLTIIDHWFAYPVHAWIWDALHTAGHAYALASPYALHSLEDALYPLTALTVLFSGLMVSPRTRRTTMAIIKFTNRHSPYWARYAMALAALIPGQADEIVLVAFLLVPILRSARNRRALARIIRYEF